MKEGQVDYVRGDKWDGCGRDRRVEKKKKLMIWYACRQAGCFAKGNEVILEQRLQDRSEGECTASKRGDATTAVKRMVRINDGMKRLDWDKPSTKVSEWIVLRCRACWWRDWVVFAAMCITDDSWRLRGRDLVLHRPTGTLTLPKTDNGL
jgi:hypothetical protein